MALAIVLGVPSAHAAPSKVTLCFGGHTIEVAQPAVQALLLLGATIGPCQASNSSSVTSSSVSSAPSSSTSSLQSSSSGITSSKSSSSSNESSDASASGASSDSSQSSDTSSVPGQSSSSSELSSASSVSSVASSEPPQAVIDHGDHNGNSEGRQQGGAQGGCRKGQPWCEDGAKTGSFGWWFPSHWTEQPRSAFFKLLCVTQFRDNGLPKFFCSFK